MKFLFENIKPFKEWLKTDGVEFSNHFDKYKKEAYIKYVSEQLDDSIKNDDLDEFTKLISEIEDFDINEYYFEESVGGGFKDTLLHHVLYIEGDKSRKFKKSEHTILKYLLENGSDVNKYNAYGEPPLMYFLRYGL